MHAFMQQLVNFKKKYALLFQINNNLLFGNRLTLQGLRELLVYSAFFTCLYRRKLNPTVRVREFRVPFVTSH